ncbi:hypothetical protein KvSKV_03600 [Ketogulonicigenium vulgare]|nr:hypothetical protein KvSKV_03600 [Ketogulonicigenium vulgare]
MMTARKIVTVTYGELTVSVEGYDAPEAILEAIATIMRDLPHMNVPKTPPALLPLRLSPEQRVPNENEATHVVPPRLLHPDETPAD